MEGINLSTVRTDFGEVLEIHVGSTKVFKITWSNASGEAVDLTNAILYASASIEITNAACEEIATISATINRDDGAIEFTVPATVTTVANAGNHIGKIVLKNNTEAIIDQRQFNFNILEC